MRAAVVQSVFYTPYRMVFRSSKLLHERGCWCSGIKPSGGTYYRKWKAWARYCPVCEGKSQYVFFCVHTIPLAKKEQLILFRVRKCCKRDLEKVLLREILIGSLIAAFWKPAHWKTLKSSFSAVVNKYSPEEIYFFSSFFVRFFPLQLSCRRRSSREQSHSSYLER